MSADFAHRLDAVQASTESLLCVGLDPKPGAVAAADLLDWCRRIIDATAAYACAFKPNSAFFEVHGGVGVDALTAVFAALPVHTLGILDAKRGDIGTTASAYAAAAFNSLGADALTVSPWLGQDSVEPFLEDPTRGAFILCHTSNPGAADLQSVEVGGEPLYLRVARLAGSWSRHANVGLVVGATYPAALAAVRAVSPHLPFLVPGVGAQGGDVAAAVAAGVNSQGRGIVVNSSRGIAAAPDPAVAARELRDRIAEAAAARVRG